MKRLVMGNEQEFFLCSGKVIVSLVAVIINSFACVGGSKCKIGVNHSGICFSVHRPTCLGTAFSPPSFPAVAGETDGGWGGGIGEPFSY